MPNDIPTPIEMGFAEFTAKLISETFDAIIVSQAAQEEKTEEMLELVNMPLDVFAEHAVTDLEVEEALRRLFPGGDEEHAHAVFVGAPYQPPTEQTSESPPFTRFLDVTFDEGDLEGGETLTEAGVAKIYAATRQRLAGARYRALQQIVTQGVPRVLVDSGRIRAKLTFQVVQIEEEEEAEEPESEPAGPTAPPLTALPLSGVQRVVGISPLERFTGLTRPFTAPNIRLSVRQADDKAPQTSQLKADIFSEVEITFKTVS
jgi:hypothetical protein